MQSLNERCAWLLPTLMVSTAWACGPFLPDSLLENPHEVLLSAPAMHFSEEIRRLNIPAHENLKTIKPSGEQTVFRHSVETDVQELEHVLHEDPKWSLSERANLPKEYERVRMAIVTWKEKAQEWRERNWWRENPSPSPSLDASLTAPAGLPKEFAYYLEGIIAMAKAQTNDACVAWCKVLDLPEKERQHRSVWATFMLGRTMLNIDRTAAIRWFKKTRQLQRDGFSDSLGLATSSLGWEALAELREKHYERALELYIQQYATGDETVLQSLKTASYSALNADEVTLVKLAQNTKVQQVLTACLISSGGGGGADWLNALEKAKAFDLKQADDFALMAYQAGDFSRAKRWLERAKKDSPSSLWIKAKLLLRDGKLDEAAAVFSTLVRLFPEAEKVSVKDFFENDWLLPDYIPALERVNGERATLEMARGEYVEALDLLLNNGHWFDAAYVAERVLTLDELRKYVDMRCPPTTLKDDGTDKASDRCRWNIRWLLGRWLIRENRLTEARKYFPEKLLPELDTYTMNLRTGRDKTKPAPTRATALASAARTMRMHGMMLESTANEPGWGSLFDGAFKDYSMYKNRMSQKEATRFVTSNERKRIQHPPATLDNRRHYRYTAADLAWEAASLMPNNSDETARFLCEAGGWLKHRDPKAANRFYLALVNRCRKTELGRQADTLRWFPVLEEN